MFEIIQGGFLFQWIMEVEHPEAMRSGFLTKTVNHL
jgi:hypothetical protein